MQTHQNIRQGMILSTWQNRWSAKDVIETPERSWQRTCKQHHWSQWVETSVVSAISCFSNYLAGNERRSWPEKFGEIWSRTKCSSVFFTLGPECQFLVETASKAVIAFRFFQEGVDPASPFLNDTVGVEQIQLRWRINFLWLNII